MESRINNAGTILETERLRLRELGSEDAPFILELLNEPDWLRFIGDRGVRTVEDARKYIISGPIAMYRREGFGLWLVELRADRTPVGICGLLKREALQDVDIGFAFLAAHRRRGYATEAVIATMAYARDTTGLDQLAAIVSPQNEASMRLVERLGFRFDEMVKLSEKSPEAKLYRIEFNEESSDR